MSQIYSLLACKLVRVFGGLKQEYLEKNEEIAKIDLKNHELWINSPNAVKPMKAHFLNASEFYLDVDGGVYVIDRKGVKTKNGKEILSRRNY